MAGPWDALQFTLVWVGWPGLALVSAFAIQRAYRFYRGLKHSVPGQLVFLMVVGWVVTLIGVALLSTLYLNQDPEAAGPAVLPVFVVWSGTLIVIVYVVHRWGKEAATLDTYYGEVERMERMKSGFINHVAHELKTPLTPLRMQLAVLRKGSLGPLTERQEESLTRIDRNVDRLGALVEEVVLASFIQSGRVSLYPQPVDLREIAREAAAGADPDAAEVVDGEPLTATVDRTRFGYAVQALIGHALALRETDDPVKVDIQRLERMGRVIIRYKGKPLRAKDFGLFADPITLEGKGHIGIDLFNAQGILSMHGGRIEAGIGSGSEIVAVVPLEPTAEVEALARA